MSNAEDAVDLPCLQSYSSQDCCSRLVLLPEAALALVLQKLSRLDPQSVFRIAKCCTLLRNAVPAQAYISQISLICCTPSRFDNFTRWLEQHNTSLTYLTECSIQFPNGKWGEARKVIGRLTCPQLRQLHLHNVELPSDLAGGCPSVLEDCTGLTALSLKDCTVSDMPAVLAALPELQSLRMAGCWGKINYAMKPADLPHPSKFTQLELDTSPKHAELLSAMFNLEHLSLKSMPPGGVPSQLVKLTCLHLTYFKTSRDAAGPLEHLSTFTALRRLEIQCDGWAGTDDLASNLSGIAYLTKLTHLALRSFPLAAFTTANTSSLAHLTALKSLELQGCDVQPAALAAFTQLRALRLTDVIPPEGTSPQELLAAISNMLRLTELHADLHGRLQGAACTALAASTQLSVLQLTLLSSRAPRKCVLFRPDTVYPHLRLIDLDHGDSGLLILSGQQLKLLCSSCPALESLNFQICSEASPTDCLPLRQLTTLTHLRVCELSKAAAAGAVVSAAAQLTGLLQLSLDDLPKLTDPKLLQLSALTALTNLTLSAKDDGPTWSIQSRNQARLLNTPDVWINLSRELLHDKACRQALLKRSTEAVATPDEGMRLQLAVKLAERLAGASSKHRPSIYYSQLEPCLALGCGIPEAGQPSC